MYIQFGISDFIFFFPRKSSILNASLRQNDTDKWEIGLTILKQPSQDYL